MLVRLCTPCTTDLGYYEVNWKLGYGISVYLITDYRSVPVIVLTGYEDILVFGDQEDTGYRPGPSDWFY